MANSYSALTLQKMVFDKIEFKRNGFKSKDNLNLSLQVDVGVDNNQNYKVTLILDGAKPKEYNLKIELSGYFRVERNNGLNDDVAQDLITKNAVAILMPYLRSELSLITAQPETDCVVLPPFNINELLKKTSV